MFEIEVACGEPGEETSLGRHVFQVPPAAGDTAMLLVGGEYCPVTVVSVYHSPKPPTGERSEAHTVIRVMERR